jgi:hypothetical protein
MKKIEDTETVDVKLKPCPFCGGLNMKTLREMPRQLWKMAVKDKLSV